MYDIVLSPVITEKATMASDHNQVTFRVPLTADKRAVKVAIEGLFNVKVKAVNTILVKGKTKRFRGRPGQRSGLQKSDRDLGRRFEDRRDHRNLVRWR